MENYEAFKKNYFSLTGIDLNAYKEKQMKRRIETLITRKNLNSFAEYAKKLEANKTELDYFTDYITINVTEFFRKPEYWTIFEEQIIPLLLEKKQNSKEKLKIWSAGCSTGEEPYSLSMLLLQYFAPEDFKIIATDIDESILKRAENGIFNEASMNSIPEKYKALSEKYFVLNSIQKSAKKQFQIKTEVKNQVEFKKLDLTQSDFPDLCDLIVCRNVLIYFTDETKKSIFTKFADSLVSGGFLFIGHTEQIVYYKNFGFNKINKNFYRKK